MTVYTLSVKLPTIMNTLKKIYCRTFQTAFRIAIPFLPYRKPEILSSMSELSSLFAKKNIKSVLLVTDPSIRGLGITNRCKDRIS